MCLFGFGCLIVLEMFCVVLWWLFGFALVGFPSCACCLNLGSLGLFVLRVSGCFGLMVMSWFSTWFVSLLLMWFALWMLDGWLVACCFCTFLYLVCGVFGVGCMVSCFRAGVFWVVIW